MTVIALLASSNILDNQIKYDLLALKEKIEHIFHAQNFDKSIITTLSKIENLIKNTIADSNFTQKSRQLEKVSRLYVQIKELIEKQNRSELVEQINYSINLVAVYTKIYQGMDLIFVAEREIDLIGKFYKYTLGYEIFATIIEEGQHLSLEICRGIEIAVNAAQQIELEERNKEENIQIPDFLKTAGRLRRTLISILWMLDKLKEDAKIEGYKTSTNSLTPYLKHMGRTPEEQLQKNQAGIKILRKWLDEKVTPEEAREREIHFELFKQIVDDERPAGHKLYPEE